MLSERIKCQNYKLKLTTYPRLVRTKLKPCHSFNVPQLHYQSVQHLLSTAWEENLQFRIFQNIIKASKSVLIFAVTNSPQSKCYPGNSHWTNYFALVFLLYKKLQVRTIAVIYHAQRTNHCSLLPLSQRHVNQETHQKRRNSLLNRVTN